MRQKRERSEFGQRLHDARKHAKLTQTQLAKAAGLSQSTLAELEYDGNASGNTAQLARACGVRTEWLAEGVGHMVDAGQLLPEVSELASELSSLPDKQRAWALDTMREVLDVAKRMGEVTWDGLTRTSSDVDEGQQREAHKRRRSA